MFALMHFRRHFFPMRRSLAEAREQAAELHGLTPSSPNGALSPSPPSLQLFADATPHGRRPASETDAGDTTACTLSPKLNAASAEDDEEAMRRRIQLMMGFVVEAVEEAGQPEEAVDLYLPLISKVRCLSLLKIRN